MYSSVITEPDSYKPLLFPKLKRGTTNWFLCYSLGIQYSGLSLPTFLGDESYRTHGCTSRELFSCRQPPLLRLPTRLSWNHKKMTSWLPCAALMASSLCRHQSSTRFFVSFDRKVRPVICKDQYADRSQCSWGSSFNRKHWTLGSRVCGWQLWCHCYNSREHNHVVWKF